MPEIPEAWTKPETTPFDFVVVGAGAAGAPLAARLAERGYRVLLTEMGPHKPPKPPDAVVENTEVPLLHAEVTEDPRHSLRFFADHFPAAAQNALDPKYHTPPPSDDPKVADESGVFYPRAQGVGGCTVHNAMITVAGPSEDWDRISEATGDASWRGERLRAYFERVETCHYNTPSLVGRVRQRLGLSTGWEGDRHGRAGWLDTTVADLGILLGDWRLLKVVVKAALGSIRTGTISLGGLARAAVTGRAFPSLDPNHWRRMETGGEGLVRIPCAVSPDGTRSDPRARLNAVLEHERHGKRLNLLTGVCVTAIEFDPGDATLAVGVTCVPQEHVYQADPNAVAATATPTKLFCRPGGEVILCGGAFNTPQLLLLSGVGPAAELASHGIEPRLNLPGVGKNLQDRYEVPVVATVAGAFESLAGLGLTSRGEVARNDPHLKRWIDNSRQPAAKRGVYATNGGLIGILKRSSFEDAVPDLFIFALAGYFPGYHLGYSKPAAFVNAVSIAEAAKDLPPGQQLAQDRAAAATPKRLVTWLLLKARTHHHGGEVTLRDANPFRRPAINFRSFPDGDADIDARALAEGVNFVRDFLELSRRQGAVESYECPGLPNPDDGNALVPWVRAVAWGHHACGTCKIGSDADAFAVLDSRFRVRGVRGLRAADASAFPRIPGVFIVTNVYMAAEKAADVLAEDHPLPPADLPAECLVALAANPVLRSRPEYEARRSYPVELEAAEAGLVRRRRAAAFRQPAPPPPTAPSTQGDAR